MIRRTFMTISMLASLLIGIFVVYQPTRLSNSAQEVSSESVVEDTQTSCSQSKWECAIPPDLDQQFKADNISYRLAVYFQGSPKIERGPLNTPSIQFNAENSRIFTCKLEVIDSKGDLLVCDDYSGRQVCIPKDSSQSIPEIVVDQPTPPDDFIISQPTGTSVRVLSSPTPYPQQQQQTQQTQRTQTVCSSGDKDFDNDGIITTIDMGRFIHKYLTNSDQADLNCDGSIDKTDWDLMRSSHFGSL
jgi:hypothetical protein